MQSPSSHRTDFQQLTAWVPNEMLAIVMAKRETPGDDDGRPGGNGPSGSAEGWLVDVKLAEYAVSPRST
jgi:hypothetical protein